MKPPYTIDFEILKLLNLVAEKIGALSTNNFIKQNPQLRKQNTIKTIHSTLNIEGNTLTLDQITAIIENKRVIGSKKEVKEVLNALEVYNSIRSFNCISEKDFLKAHQLLLTGLIENAGKYRTKSVGILKGSEVKHLAPPAQNVPSLMKDLFKYVKDKNELTLIKSCVFHYEMEFIHPFLDGNGRMGRLWQTLILMNDYPLFEYLPFETLIAKNQKKYYKALADSDKDGHSTKFIKFMLQIIHDALAELLTVGNKKLTDIERLQLFLENNKQEFSRKEYMQYFPELSTATASRDLRKGVELKFFKKVGDKNKASYVVTSN